MKIENLFSFKFFHLAFCVLANMQKYLMTQIFIISSIFSLNLTPLFLLNVSVIENNFFTALHPLNEPLIY